MTWDLFMHWTGIVSLACIAAVAIGSICNSIVPNRARIYDTARGRPWTPRRHPVSPTASVLPLRTSVPKLRADEARAQPTHEAA